MRLLPALIIFLAACSHPANPPSPTGGAPTISKNPVTVSSARITTEPRFSADIISSPLSSSLDTGYFEVITTVTQKGKIVYHDSAQLHTATQIIVTSDTTSPHIVLTLSSAQLNVGDTVRVTAKCYAKGNVPASTNGYIHSADPTILQFNPSTVAPPATAKALKIGSTSVIAVCWPSGPSGIEATIPLTVISSTSSVDTSSVDSVLVLPRAVALAPADSDCAALPEAQKFDSTGTPVWQCTWVDPFGKVVASSVAQFCSFVHTKDGNWHLTTDQQLSTPCINFSKDSSVVHPFSSNAISQLRIPSGMLKSAMKNVRVQVI